MKKIFFTLLFVIFLVGTISAFDWNEGIVTYYQLEELSGAVVDSVGNYNGTYNGSSQGVTGKINNAYDFELDDSDWINSSIQPDWANFTICMWINLETSSGTLQRVFNYDNPTLNYGSKGITLYDDDIYVGMGGSDVNWDYETTGEWDFICVVRNPDESKTLLYINGTNVANGTIGTTASGDGDTFVHFATGRNYDTQFYDGLIDEIGIWNRSLTTDEIVELYNEDIGLTYEDTGLNVTITLISPEDDSTISTNEIEFLANYSMGTPTYNLTNTTLFIWYNNGTLFNETTVIITGQTNDTNITVSNFTLNDYIWNMYTCYSNGVSNCEWDLTNYSFSWIPFSVDAINYLNTTLETSYQTFILNISSAEGYTAQNGRLIYDGTEYSNAIKTEIDSDSISLSRSIYIPAGTSGFGSENRSFYWNITMVNENTGETFYAVTSEYNQTVNELLFGLCGGDLDVVMVNFTIYDEETGILINSTANPVFFQATFSLGAYYEQKLKNYSIDNQSVDNSSFAFCSDNENNTYYVDMEAMFSAVNYAEKNYFLTNSTLTNNTNEISLYLLNESNSIEFFIDVEQDLRPVTSATVNIKKYFVGEGVYKTVEIDETSSDKGEFTAYLDLDQKYSFTITKDGEVLGTVIKTASCKEAPCELTLSLSSALANVYETFGEFFAQNVVYSLTFDANTKIVTFDFVDTTGLANYFRMTVEQVNYDSSTSFIIDTSLYTSSGTITGNLSNYSSGDFVAKVYVARSPELFIDYLNISISELAGTFGLLGLLVTFIFILTIIFGISFNPAMFVLSVPLSITIGKLIGFFTISWGSIAVVFVLAITAVFLMSK